jgi:hypothetical protein
VRVADRPTDATGVSATGISTVAVPVTSSPSPWGPTEQPSAAPAAPEPRSFATLWEFALALNRHDAAAVALASDGTTCDIPIDSSEIRRLLGTVWFRSAFRYLSPHWRDRLLDVLLNDTVIGNHLIRDGRRSVRLAQMSSEALERVATDVTISEVVRADVQLLMAIDSMWGADALSRVTFAPVEAAAASAFGAFLLPFRHM